MRTLSELVETDDPAWPEIEAAVAAAPYSVVVLDADPRRADDELVKLQVTTRSWLGAVVHRTGGLVIDDGWLRVLGAGNAERHLASLSAVNEPVAAGLIVAQDVLGGQFAWAPADSGEPTISYFSPDALRWEDCEMGYGRWLAAMIGGGATGFYETLRWRGWAAETVGCRLDHAISLWPPPWTKEGKDLNTVARRPVPMAEMMSMIGIGSSKVPPKGR